VASTERSVTDWPAISILIVGGFVAAFHVGKAAIAVPLLRHDLNISLFVASMIVSAFATLGALGGLGAGIAVSRLPMRETTIAGLLIIGISSVLGAASPNWESLLATRIFEGCGFLAVVIAVPALIRTLAAPRDREFALACWGVYLPGGSAIMMLAGPALGAFGWQVLWLANGASAVLYAIVVAAFVARADNAQRRRPSSIAANVRAVIAARGPAMAAMAFGTYTFHYFALTGLMPTLLVERMGLSVAEAGGLSAATVVANAAGNLAAGAALRLGVPLWAIIAVAFAFCGVAAIGIFAQSLPVAFVALLASMSLAITGLVPASIFAATPRLAPNAQALGITLGLVIQASNLGQLFGPAALAAFVEHVGWSSAPFLFAVIAATGIALALRLRALLRKSTTV
jgi:MFS transporter, DHA1 family, inner membrane transport protein